MRLRLKFSEDKPFKMGFSEVNLLPGGTGEPYTGEYEITPDFSEHTLQTRYKSMLDNVTVHAIPASEIDNAAGGVTFSI